MIRQHAPSHLYGKKKKRELQQKKKYALSQNECSYSKNKKHSFFISRIKSQGPCDESRKKKEEGKMAFLRLFDGDQEKPKDAQWPSYLTAKQ